MLMINLLEELDHFQTSTKCATFLSWNQKDMTKLDMNS